MQLLFVPLFRQSVNMANIMIISSRLMMMKITISNYPDWADRIGGEGMAGHACNY